MVTGAFPAVALMVFLSKVPRSAIVPKRNGSGLPFKPLNELVSYHFAIQPIEHSGRVRWIVH